MAASSSGWSPTVTASTRTAWSSSIAAVSRLDRALQRGRFGLGAPAVQPRAQLALLPPGEARHLLGIVGALDQDERLEHGVVEVGGERGPLLLAHPQPPLLVEPADEPADRRCGEHGDAGDGDRDGADGTTDVGQPAGAVGHRGDASDGERRRRPRSGRRGGARSAPPQMPGPAGRASRSPRPRPPPGRPGSSRRHPATVARRGRRGAGPVSPRRWRARAGDWWARRPAGRRRWRAGWWSGCPRRTSAAPIPPARVSRPIAARTTVGSTRQWAA